MLCKVQYLKINKMYSRYQDVFVSMWVHLANIIVTLRAPRNLRHANAYKYLITTITMIVVQSPSCVTVNYVWTDTQIHIRLVG
jgi:hypothetical protein